MTPRRRRILYAASTSVGVLMLGAAVIYFLVLPWIVRNRLSAVLRAQGLEHFSFHVPIATLRRAVVTDLKLGDGENHVERLTAHFSIESIRQGRLDSIRFEGINLVASVAADGVINLGPLAPLLKRSTTKPTTQSSESTVLPADRMEITDSKLIVKSPTATTAVPLAASVISSNNTIKVEMSTELGSPVAVTGTVNAKTRESRFTLNAPDVDAPALTRLISTFVPGLGLGLQGRLKVEAAYTQDREKGSLDAQLTATSATTQPAASDPNVLLTSGVFHLVGTVTDQTSTATLSIHDTTLTERSQSMEITGVSGDVHLAALAPLTSPPGQRVHVQQAKVGELTLSDGIVEFQVTSPQSIQIQHTQWNTLGGQVLANDATIQNGNINATLRAEKLDLKQLLELFAKDKAAGKGSLSGDIKIAYTDGTLHILSGQLQSKGSGQLQIKEAEGIAGQVSKRLSKGNAQEQVKTELIQSLKDFQFTQMTGELTRETSGLVARVHIRGHGRTGAKVPILYDLNLFGLDPLIRSSLRLREAISSQHNGQGKVHP